ncbi:MAG: fimbrillin family protein [Prevotella sp.]|nr:fimbrillin family protein [Prevotella sp.]
MKQMKSIILLTAMTALAACSSEDTAQLRQDDSLVPITFSAVDIQLMTRAADGLLTGNFGAGKDINVSIKAGSAAAADYTFCTAAGGGMSLKETDPAQSVPYYPAGDNATIIKAWYPADASAIFAVRTAQNVDANYEASDLMYGKPWETSTETYIDGCSIAKPATNPAPAVNLKFEHLLAKVRVKLTKGTGITSITGITLKDVKTSVTFDSSAGTATTIDGTTADVTVASGTTDIADDATYYTAVIPAQALSGQFLEIVTNAGSAYYSATKTLSAGHLYTIELTVNSVAIGLTNTITSWGDSEAIPSVGGLEAAFTIADIADQEYTGSAVTFEPSDLTVRCNGTTVASTDYDVICSDNIIPGTATCSVIGKGGYAGIYGEKTFTITPRTISSATNAEVSWIVSTDGYMYHSSADLFSAGKSPIAMVAYVSSTGHGLAIALEDAGRYTIDALPTALTAWDTAHPVSFGTWKTPTGDDWKYMFEACGGATYDASPTLGDAYSFGNFVSYLYALGDYGVRGAAYTTGQVYVHNSAYFYCYVFRSPDPYWGILDISGDAFARFAIAF